MNGIASSLVNGVLGIDPLAKFIKNRARNMMIDRAETLGVHWRDEVKALQRRKLEVSGLEVSGLKETESEATGTGQADSVHPQWEKDLAAVTNPDTVYPGYYTAASFHAYEESNLGWRPAMELDVAAQAVHARIWPKGDERAGLPGDVSLRSSYNQALTSILPTAPEQIIDLGCGVGLSSFTLKTAFPAAQVTGVDLSPYFLAVAQYHLAHGSSSVNPSEPDASEDIQWVHAAAEDTGMPAESADLVSACLMFHELPSTAARQIIAEAYRLVRPGGYFAIMDMDPACQTFAKMPPYVFTLLRSTEPFLDQYLTLDLAEAIETAGFSQTCVVSNSPRHRTIVGKKEVGKKE
ncbi:MAG: class I SAM-dependent methyltransferase [Phormidesmis sp.]